MSGLAAIRLEFFLGHRVMCKRESKEVVRDLKNTKRRRKKKPPYPKITVAKLKETFWCPVFGSWRSRKLKDQRTNNAYWRTNILILENILPAFKGRLRASAEAGGGTEQKAPRFSPFDVRTSLGEKLLCRYLKTSIFLAGVGYREYPEGRPPVGVIFVVNLGLLCKSSIEE